MSAQSMSAQSGYVRDEVRDQLLGGGELIWLFPLAIMAMIPFARLVIAADQALSLASSRLPSFSYRTESIGENLDFSEHGGEPLDQRSQPVLRHCWDEIVEHAALTEQRVGTAFRRI